MLCSRRKRGEKGEVVETIEDVIVRRLTTERIEELKRLLRDTQEQYRYVHAVLKTTKMMLLPSEEFMLDFFSFPSDRKLKKDVDLTQTGHMDSQLKELCTEITL